MGAEGRAEHTGGQELASSRLFSLLALWVQPWAQPIHSENLMLSLPAIHAPIQIGRLGVTYTEVVELDVPLQYQSCVLPAKYNQSDSEYLEARGHD